MSFNLCQDQQTLGLSKQKRVLGRAADHIRLRGHGKRSGFIQGGRQEATEGVEHKKDNVGFVFEKITCGDQAFRVKDQKQGDQLGYNNKRMVVGQDKDSGHTWCYSQQDSLGIGYERQGINGDSGLSSWVNGKAD